MANKYQVYRGSTLLPRLYYGDTASIAQDRARAIDSHKGIYHSVECYLAIPVQRSFFIEDSNGLTIVTKPPYLIVVDAIRIAKNLSGYYPNLVYSVKDNSTGEIHFKFRNRISL